MSIILQEIKLLELFSSSDYFGKMRDKWEQVVSHTESCLDAYMNHLAPNYRSKPVPEQPDVVWGHRVLPNFRHTLEQLNEAYIRLTHGDTNALAYADNVRSDFKGQLDYSPDWMSELDQRIYSETMNRAVAMAHNISITEHAWWARIDPESHIKEFNEFPTLSSACNYRVNRNVYVRSGDKTQVSGIYAPDMENCCPQFLGSHRDSAPATKMWIGIEDLLHPETGEKYDEQNIYKKVDCTWYLVEKSDTKPVSEDNISRTYPLLRVVAAETCPQTGFYFTPALPGSRRRFVKGEVMPSLDSNYGQTIWQWDEAQ